MSPSPPSRGPKSTPICVWCHERVRRTSFCLTQTLFECVCFILSQPRFFRTRMMLLRSCLSLGFSSARGTWPEVVADCWFSVIFPSGMNLGIPFREILPDGAGHSFHSSTRTIRFVKASGFLVYPHSHATLFTWSLVGDPTISNGVAVHVLVFFFFSGGHRVP